MRAPLGTAPLTAGQVAQYAYQAGFRGEALITAVAVAHAESGFDPSNVGDVNLTQPGEQSVGLWQINYRPTRDSATGTRSPTANLDPLTNARNAYTISGGGSNFRPWSTFTSGAYKQYLPEARTAADGAAAGVTPTTDGAPGTDNGQPILAVTSGEQSPVLPLTIGGKDATGELGEAIVGGTVDFSTNGVSEVSVELSDPDFALCRRYRLQPAGSLHLFDLPFRVVQWGLKQGPGAPHVTLTAQPEGVVRMRQTAPASRSGISPTDYMQQVAQAAGLRFVGEASASVPSIGPAQVPDTRMSGLLPAAGFGTAATRPENAWEVGQRLASVLGFYAFEAAGTFYFASANYLIGQGQQVQISTDGETFGASLGPVFDGLGIPTVTITQLELDSATQARAGAGNSYLVTDVLYLHTLIQGSVDRDGGINLRPGMRARWTGIGPFLTGISQMVTRVSWDLADLTAPVRVEAGNPQPKTGTGRTAADDQASLYGNTGTAGSNLQTVGPKPTVLDFVTECIRQAGRKYTWGGEDPQHGFDCSGLVQWAAQQLGVSLPRTAGEQYAAVQKAGLTMSVAQAFKTRGAVLYRANNADPGLGEHIVVSLGDGRHTIEARGAAYGVVEGPITGRTWTGAGKLPGFTY